MTFSALPEAVMRMLGAAFNLALAVLFVWLAVSLYETGVASLEAAGGLASGKMLRAALSDPAVAVGWVAGFMNAPGAGSRIVSYVVAWFALIGAAGSAWMALLGIRWAYHAALRLLMTR